MSAAVKQASRIRIMIAEDHLIARLGVGAIVNAQPDMSVIAEATNGQQAVTLYREYRPDVTLMDMRMPVLDGLDAVAGIRKEFPDARIVALSTYSGDDEINRAFLAGVRGYLTKDVLHGELIEAIRVVHAGETYIPVPVAAALRAQQPRSELSARELEVLALIVKGSSNKQIAFTLSITEYTVKNHVKNIFAKLNVEDRTQATTAAIRRGIVHLNS
jgi:two-component system NarL family response regulator